ncbi:MAG: hypothetical protein JSR31_13165 [Nitrospira sp.]|nr:hypothetical protein [Nitrospira sp.]
MAKFIVAIKDDMLKRARIQAREEGTSVSAVLRDYLAEYAGMKVTKEKAISNLLWLSQHAKSRRGNYQWIRGELHER